jgi:diguanylate cyclase (GGDEF)-like protein
MAVSNRTGKAKCAANAVPDARRIMVLSSLAIIIMMLTVLGVVVYSIHAIDSAAVNSEMTRARVALTVLNDSNGSSEMARRIADNYALAGARFGTGADIATDEVALPVPGRGELKLIWTPIRSGTDLFYTLAPIRVSASAVFLIGVLVLMRRLYALARELEERRREAQALAARDTLTGLGNRLAFDDGMALALAQGKGEVALFYLDLDGFKQVNDTFGHGAGDDVLRIVGERLAKLVASDDMVARIGGDEFAIVRPGAGSRDELTGFALRVETALREPIVLGTTAIPMGVSIGIAVAPADGRTATELVEAADVALYRAKRDRTGFAMADAA